MPPSSRVVVVARQKLQRDEVADLRNRNCDAGQHLDRISGLYNLGFDA